MPEFSVYVGLDVHKDTIAVAVAVAGRSAPQYHGKSRGTQAHFCWLERIKMPTPVQQVVLAEYVDTVMAAQRRVAARVEPMRLALDTWSLRPVVEALMALRGVHLMTAMTVRAELGDITRFDSPSQLMAYLGLGPREHATGHSRHPDLIWIASQSMWSSFFCIHQI